MKRPPGLLLESPRHVGRHVDHHLYLQKEFIMKSPRKLSRRTLIVFTLLCVAALQPVFGQSFTVKDLGTLPNGFGSVARGINDRGRVVGDSATNGLFQPHAFSFRHGVMVDLGTLPGGTASGAAGINNRGEIVGESTTASGDTHAFLFEDGAMVDLGTLGGAISRATAINDRGQIVGSSSLAAPFQFHAFLVENGVMVDLGTLPGGRFSEALGINNRGQVVGSSNATGQLNHAALWTPKHGHSDHEYDDEAVQHQD